LRPGATLAATAGLQSPELRVLTGSPGKLALTAREAELVDLLSGRPTLAAWLELASERGYGALEGLALLQVLGQGGWLDQAEGGAPRRAIWVGPLRVLVGTWITAIGLLIPVTPAGLGAAATTAVVVAAGLTALWTAAPWLSRPGELLAQRWLGVHQARARSWAWLRRRLWSNTVRRRALDPLERAYLALGTWNLAHLVATMLFGGAVVAARAQQWAYGPGLAGAWLPAPIARLLLLGALAALTVGPGLVLAWMALSGLGQLLPRRATPPLRTTAASGEAAEHFASELASLPIFQGVKAELLRELAAAAVLEDYADGAAVLRQGEPGHRLCWLANGRVRVRVEDEAGLVYDVASLGPGALFGETSLLEAVPRTATVLADGPVQVVALSRDAFARLLEGQAASAAEVREHIRTAAALRSHPLFQALDAQGLRGVLGSAQVVRCAAGDDVVTQNQPGDHLYVVREGSLRVHRSTPKGPKRLATLQAGDWFGELALLGAGVRTATVTAETPCVLVRLHRDAVDQALSRDLAGALLLLEAAAERLARLRAGEVA